MRGIYSIRNLITGDLYIGSSEDVEVRIRYHLDRLRRNGYSINSDDRKPYLQNAWNKYGEQVFKFKCIDEVEDGRDLLEVEQYYLDIFWPTGYNENPVAGQGPRFKDLSFEKQERMRDRCGRGKTLEEMHGAGRAREILDERSRKLKGKSRSNTWSKPCPEECTCGRHTVTNEMREKNRQAQIRIGNRPPSQKGKKWSSETNRKRGESTREAWRKKRERR